MSGAGVPVLTPTPTPTRASVTAVPGATASARDSSPAGDSRTTSNASPALMRLVRAPTVSLRRVTARPVAASNAGLTSAATALIAPALSTVRSAARAGAASSRAASSQRISGSLGPGRRGGLPAGAGLRRTAFPAACRARSRACRGHGPAVPAPRGRRCRRTCRGSGRRRG